MSTATEVDVSDLTEFEFATPCQSMEGCDLQAVALYSRSHTLEGCWGDGVTMCQMHLVKSLRSYEEWLSHIGICSVCHGRISGGLPTNTRIVRL